MYVRLDLIAIGLGLLVPCGASSCTHLASTSSATAADEEPAKAQSASDTDSAQAWLLVDADMGLDDARVILALPLQGAFHVSGITTVEGSAGAMKGADNALRLLEAVGAKSIPVAIGATKTIAGHAIPAPMWRSMAESLGGLALPAPTRPMEDTPAAVFLASALRLSASPVTILALGPLTNLARALSDDPTLVEKIQLVAMLGDFMQCSSYNCSADPVAADIVRNSGVRRLMMMPSATDRITFDEAFLARVQALSGSAGKLMVQMMQHHIGRMKLWDDSVLEALLEPEHFTTIAAGPSTALIVDLDPEGVEQALLDLWNAQSPDSP
ncbi:MAG TPA: nucleoside hydrolase [Myxococcota bacterium]|nr:nucleoside hydrolase [Myxococcota bacterium]HRY97397.1 nucleoside hydrolase [Myxococcota bacterium]